MDKIDFVITWVDGNDIEWQQKKQKYESRKNDKDANNITHGLFYINCYFKL